MTLLGKRQSELERHTGLSHAAFAREDKHNVLDIIQAHDGRFWVSTAEIDVKGVVNTIARYKEYQELEIAVGKQF